MTLPFNPGEKPDDEVPEGGVSWSGIGPTSGTITDDGGSVTVETPSFTFGSGGDDDDKS